MDHFPKALQLILPCDHCGGAVEFMVNQHADINPLMVYHEGCASPVVTLITHNPQRLGVVSSETLPSAPAEDIPS